MAQQFPGIRFNFLVAMGTGPQWLVLGHFLVAVYTSSAAEPETKCMIWGRSDQSFFSERGPVNSRHLHRRRSSKFKAVDPVNPKAYLLNRNAGGGHLI